MEEEIKMERIVKSKVKTAEEAASKAGIVSNGCKLLCTQGGMRPWAIGGNRDGGWRPVIVVAFV